MCGISRALKEPWRTCSKLNRLSFFFLRSRADICVDLQRVPELHSARQPAIHLSRDGEPVHRKSGAIRRWQLHLCGKQHCDEGEGAQLSDTAGPQK